MFQAGKKFFGDAGLAKRGTQAVAQRLNVIQILAKNQPASHFQRVADAIGLDERVAVAVSADPGTEVNKVGYGDFIKIDGVDVAEGFHDLGINLGQCVEQRESKVAQAHANFIVDCRLSQTDFVGLPKRGDFRADLVFTILRFFGRKRKVVEAFQLLRDAATLQQNGLPGDFGRMRGEDRGDRNLAERGDGIFCRDSSVFHAQKSSAKRAGKRSVFTI